MRGVFWRLLEMNVTICLIHFKRYVMSCRGHLRIRLPAGRYDGILGPSFALLPIAEWSHLLRDASLTEPVNRQRKHLLAQARNRRKNSRERIFSVAAEVMGASGYAMTTVDDIIAKAGLSRATFYRHFRNKAELVMQMYEQFGDTGRSRLLGIAERDWSDRGAIRDWIAQLFSSDQRDRLLLSVFAQAAAVEPDVTAFAHDRLGALIRDLGKSIPAFAVDPELPAERARWLEAWLLLFELLDQSNHAARNSGIATDPLVVDILAERFHRFVTAQAETAT